MMVPCAITAPWRLGLTSAHAGFAGHGPSISTAIRRRIGERRKYTRLEDGFYKRHTKPEDKQDGRKPHVDRHEYQSLLWKETVLIYTGERNSHD